MPEGVVTREGGGITVGKRMRFALESVPMLPKSRIVSALAIGLGLALVAWGVLFPYIVPTDARLPLSLKQTTMTLVDQHATQRIPSDGTTYTGPMTKHELPLSLSCLLLQGLS